MGLSWGEFSSALPQSVLVSCSSFLLLTAAHKPDISFHFLNGPPALLRLCHSLLLYHCPPRCTSKLSFRPPHHFISLCCLLLSSSYCHVTTSLRDRQSHGTRTQRMQAGKEGNILLMNPLGPLSLKHRHPEEARRFEVEAQLSPNPLIIKVPNKPQSLLCHHVHINNTYILANKPIIKPLKHTLKRWS